MTTGSPAQAAADSRRFIRHPAGVPIFVEAEDSGSTRPDVVNVSEGGLCFTSDAPLPPGALVRLRIPVDEPPFTARAVVVWCRSVAGGCRIGVRFLDEQTAYCARMVEQVCHIQQYRRRVRDEEGRELTRQQAAAEWVARYAAGFPEA